MTSAGLGYSDSRVDLCKHGRRVTVTHLLTADNMASRMADDGNLMLELFEGSKSYLFTIGQEDQERLRLLLSGRVR